MRKNVILGFVTAALVVFGATSASSLSLEATIGNIWISSFNSSSVAGLVIDGNGNATANLAVGNIIIVDIAMDIEFQDLLTLGATITFLGDQVEFAFVNALPPKIWEQNGPGVQPGLNDIGSGAIKGNSPFPDDGTGGDVWLQAVAYGNPLGTNGDKASEQLAMVSYAFTVTGGLGASNVSFRLGFTAGDGSLDKSSVAVIPNFISNGASVNIPEPGTALLMGLGLAGLATAGRRRKS